MPCFCHIPHPFLSYFVGTSKCVTAEVERSVSMQTLTKGYRGLSVLMDLNWDRVLYLLTIAVALAAGAFVGSFQ